jgi:hypothetical protein
MSDMLWQLVETISLVGITASIICLIATIFNDA